ncbi:MAG: hypothetical protein OEY13_08830 [Gammaproteobacteria bacterium]|nr:hypothetical protein [Gammaproteobacteria bacterium]MDH4255539.1 hypothetical protein [Gammaproteobacteria bacterium]MDH5273166.1 hypothetical protein [Gammaproteobacteria bacterium]
MNLSPYSAPIARIGKFRSAGIKDLRHGTITLDDDQDQRLPDGVSCTPGSTRRAMAQLECMTAIHVAMNRIRCGSATID